MKRILICIAAVCTALMGSGAMAAGLNVPDVNYQTSTVIISGNAGTQYAGNMVSLQVINLNKSFADIKTDPNALNWSDQNIVDEDGNFSFTFTMSGETGDYDYFVGVSGMRETLVPGSDKKIKFFGPNEAESVWTRIEEATENGNKNDILWAINERKELLQIDTTVFDSLAAQEPDVISPAQEGILTGILETDMKDLSEFKAAFEDCMDIYDLYLPQNAAMFETNIKIFLDDAADEVRELYGLLSAEEKGGITDALKEAAVYSKKGLIDLYAESVLKQSFNKIELRAEMDNFIVKYARIDADVLDDYNNLKDRMVVAEKMLKKLPLDDMASFENELIYQIGMQETFEKKPSKKPSGGGGGGGVSYGVTTPQDNNKAPETNDTENESTIKDVALSHWAYNGIKSLMDKKIISGYSDGSYRPENNVTRAEFLQMLVKAFGLAEKEGRTEFSDVKNSDWFLDAVQIGYTNGIVSGTNDGRFLPNNSITRQDMMTMLYNCANAIGAEILEGNAGFLDNDMISKYALVPISAMTEMGIVNGYNDGTVRPLGTATRAEAATVINKMIEYVSGGIV